MGCACQSENKQVLLYACSGAANTGEMADQVARTLMREGKGVMTCLAGIGAELSGFVVSVQAAKKNIVLDGCKVACGKKLFDRLGLDYEHYLMTDYGVKKNKTPITSQLVREAADHIAARIVS